MRMEGVDARNTCPVGVKRRGQLNRAQSATACPCSPTSDFDRLGIKAFECQSPEHTHTIQSIIHPLCFMPSHAPRFEQELTHGHWAISVLSEHKCTGPLIAFQFPAVLQYIVAYTY